MIKFFAILSWLAVFIIAAISLILVLLESWSGVVISMALAPAIGIAMLASEEAGL